MYTKSLVIKDVSTKKFTLAHGGTSDMVDMNDPDWDYQIMRNNIKKNGRVTLDSYYVVSVLDLNKCLFATRDVRLAMAECKMLNDRAKQGRRTSNA